MWLVTHFLRYSSLKCSKQTFTVRSAIVNSFTSSVFPSEANGKTENWEKLFLSCVRFRSLLVAFRNSKPRRHSEIKQTTIHEARLFRGNIVKTKHRGLTSLTFMTRPGRQPSGPPYLHSVYSLTVLEDKNVQLYWFHTSGFVFKITCFNNLAYLSTGSSDALRVRSFFW